MHCHLMQEFEPPSGELKAAIEAKWKSMDNFVTTFNTQAAAVQVGSHSVPWPCSCRVILLLLAFGARESCLSPAGHQLLPGVTVCNQGFSPTFACCGGFVKAEDSFEQLVHVRTAMLRSKNNFLREHLGRLVRLESDCLNRRSPLASVCVLQGSGWCWLGYNKATSGLEISAMPNQDPLSVTVGLYVV